MLAATYAVLDQEISDIGIKAVAHDLKDYDGQAVGMALTRCRKELRRMTLADIIERIPGEHPGAEEAWAIVSQTVNNETVSIAWTQPMQVAYGVAYNLPDDLVAARMAFKESYQREVSKARALNQRPVWQASLGFDPAGREQAQEKASSLNRLSLQSFKALANKVPELA
jgi:hypothetical protein